jgi:hypothetical protein
MENDAVKICPFCKEQIRKEAVKCMFCGEWLEEGHQPKTDSISEQKPKVQPSVSNANQEMIGQSVDVGTAATTTEAPISESLAGQIRTMPIPRNRVHLHNKPLIPLFLISLWVFCYVMPLAIKNGASDFIGIISGTLSYCTTPVSLLVLLILTIWFWSWRRQTGGETFKQSPRWLIIIIGLLVGVLAYGSISSALDSRAAVQRQRLLANGVNPDALKGWEVLKRDQQLGDATGLTPAAKKRMRETFALELRGTGFTNFVVDLQGDDHDRLVMTSSSNPIATNLHEALQQADVDFWNRLRLLDFSEVVFTGTNYSESIPKSKIKEWSHNYETYVSNMHAMYQGQMFDAGENDLNPTMQKTMRQNLASALNGGLKSIYKSLEVRLEGENEDKMVLYLPEMNARVADGLLKTFRQDKTGNFWNGLRALGCSELILSGDNYRRSIPQNEFIQWCRDYEKYLSELRKVAGQISGGLKQEAKAP